MEMTELPLLRSFEHGRSPRELIEVCAYFKWKQRCRDENAEVHGFHEEDWLAAEKEVSVTVLELIELAPRVFKSKIPIDQHAIEIRAYYLSLERPDSDPQAIWAEASSREWQFQFAQLIHRLLRRVDRFSIFDPGSRPATATV